MKKFLANAIAISFVAFGVMSGCTTDNISGTVTDADGNVYQTVKIGNQVWMAENLRTTKYNDGTSIPNLSDATDWIYDTTGACCWYNNDSATYKKTYGALYNWTAINTGKLSPLGWHVPSDSEWNILANYLGSEIVAGGLLKKVDNAHWNSPNTDATNTSGFSALPSGVRCSNGAFNDIGDQGYWWSVTGNDAANSWYRKMYFNSANLDRYNNDSSVCGFSVRCVKNN